MKFIIKNIVTFAILCNFSIVYANDTSVSVASSGITFQKNDNISMEKEKLEIFYDKINVEYEFYNSSTQDIDLHVAFPLPIYNCQYIPFDELFIDLVRKDGQQINVASPFLDFKI